MKIINKKLKYSFTEIMSNSVNSLIVMKKN